MDLDRDIDIIKLRLNKAYDEKVYWRNIIPISILGVIFMWFFFFKISENMSASTENIGIVVCVALSVMPLMCKTKMEECQGEFADLYKFYLSRLALEKYFYDIEYDVSNAMSIEYFFLQK